MATLKKPAEVVAAEAMEEQKRAEWQSAVAAAKQAEQDYHAACRASREARVAADASLPQCRMVTVKRYGRGGEEDAGRLVVVKKTPTGILVTRRVGVVGSEYRFKWNAHTGRWHQAEKTSWTSSPRELRDVPAQFRSQSEGGAQ